MDEVTTNGLTEVRKLIEEGDRDLLRTMVKQMAEALMQKASGVHVARRLLQTAATLAPVRSIAVLPVKELIDS